MENISDKLIDVRTEDSSKQWMNSRNKGYLGGEMTESNKSYTPNQKGIKLCDIELGLFKLKCVFKRRYWEFIDRFRTLHVNPFECQYSYDRTSSRSTIIDKHISNL